HAGTRLGRGAPLHLPVRHARPRSPRVDPRRRRQCGPRGPHRGAVGRPRRSLLGDPHRRDIRGAEGRDVLHRGIRCPGNRREAALFELTFQNVALSYHWLGDLTSFTYWNSEFTVVGLALLWVYFRRHGAFPRFRNTILLANAIGLVGYVLVPTAPPRMFASF